MILDPKPSTIYSHHIGLRKSDGLHALLFSSGLYTWTNTGEVIRTVITPQFAHATPGCDFAGELLVMADIGVGVGIDGPMKIAEYNVDIGEYVRILPFGTNLNRQPIVRGLPSGGCVVMSWLANTAAAFDLFYRSPVSGQWIEHRQEHENVGIPASNWTMCCGTDGLLYVFGTHDASTQIMLFRYAEDIMNGLVLVDFDLFFFHGYPHNGVYPPFAPNGEVPYLHAQVDAKRNRVVIAYQKFDYIWDCGVIQSPVNIVGIKPGPVVKDLERELVGIPSKPGGDWEWSGHGNPCYVFARPDGIYYAMTKRDNQICEAVERNLFGGFTWGGVVRNPDNSPCHQFMAASVDGWIMRRIINEDWSETFYLEKMNLPPFATLKNIGAGVKIDWDQETTHDFLEFTDDLNGNPPIWTQCYAGEPPVILENTTKKRHYRVRQEPK